MKSYYLWKCVKFGLLITGGVLLFGWLFMLLWNCLVPDLFGGPVLQFVEALGLLVLSKIIFGGFKGGSWGSCCGSCCHSHGRKHSYWKQKMEARMANMTPEEQEKFKAKWKNCGWTEEKSE